MSTHPEISTTNRNGNGEFRVSEEMQSGYITGMSFTNQAIQYAVIDGQAVFEGDILLGSAEALQQAKQAVENPPVDEETGERGLVITGARYRWPNGLIPYLIDRNLTDPQRVTDAIQHWEDQTNVRFRPRTSEANYVVFQPGDGCASFVGMIRGAQAITLGAGCSTGNAIHEIGHAVGLWHEHSRADRDRFVTIVWDNIQNDARHNFNQHITDGDDVATYDYGSIMHYPAWGFAIDATKPTIIAPEPIGQRTALSQTDIRTVNSIYPSKTTLGDTSGNGPALATKDTNLLLSWTGTGNLRLNFMRSTDGRSFGNKVTLNDTSPDAPALTVYKGRYIVAWIGTGNHQLNVMQSNDGRSWSDKVTLGDTSLSSPALAVLGGWLYIAWRGVGNDRLNVMRSQDGKTWQHKQTLGDTTTAGPALAALNDRLLLGWRGVGNNQLNVLQSLNGTSFFGKVTLRDTTPSKPCLFVHEGEAYLCWQGVGNVRLNLMSSRDGVTWGGKIIAGETCMDGPVLGAVDNRLLWGWTGTDVAHRLNMGLI